MISKKVLLFVLISLTCLRLQAQQEGNIWTFGYHAGLDFSSGYPIAITSSVSGGNGEAQATVCNQNGQLLFYTDGTIVWDRNGNIMPNGGALISAPLNESTPTSSASMGALIVPKPGVANQYYIFSAAAFESGLDGVYYSLVDMGLNNGLGDVVSSQEGILLASGMTERITAVVGDRCNIWLLTRAKYSNIFKAFSITNAGINTVPQESTVGTPSFTGGYVGQIAVSPDRKKVVVCAAGFPFGQTGGLEMFDFDPVTGIFSNSLILSQGTGFYGAAFSPDNSKLYGSTPSSVYQFDMLSPAPESTQTLIGTCSQVTHLKLAPDQKIYMIGTDNTHMSAINAPDLLGTACDFVQNAVALLPNTIDQAGLPNVVPVIPHDTFYSQQSATAPCFGTGFAITAPDDSTGWDYVWNTGAVTTSISPTSPGSYWVTYRTPPCNYHTDTFVVTFPDGVLPAIAIDTACAGAINGGAHAYTYPGDTVAYHYAWINIDDDTLSLTDQLQAVPAGPYKLHIATAQCDTLLQFAVPEADYRVSFEADTLVCTDQNIDFTNTSDDHYNNFNWNFGDENSSTETNPIHTYIEPGSYEVVLTGAGSICNDTARRVITVDAPDTGFDFMVLRNPLCIGEQASIIVHSDNTIAHYSWDYGDNTTYISTNDSEQHAYDKAGAYRVQLTGLFRACPDISISDTIQVYPFPVVNLSPDSVLCLGGSPIRLENLIADSGTCHYEWSTGDTAAGIEIRHPGTYSLTVTQEPAGCATTDAVTINKDCYIDIPNAFTPNGDGANDYFFPRQYLSKSVIQFRMQVLNRWGQKIFETTSIEGRGWDGRFNGKEQPAGVYVYIIDVTLASDRQEHYQGNVTLLR